MNPSHGFGFCSFGVRRCVMVTDAGPLARPSVQGVEAADR